MTDDFDPFEPLPWTNRAACHGLTDLFFPERGSAVNVQQAKAVCETCPVLAECRQYALRAGTRLVGVWGGMAENDRRRARQAKRIELGLGPRDYLPKRQAS